MRLTGQVLRPLVLCVPLLSALGCEEDPTALLITLVANPEFNTATQVLEATNRLDIVVDTDEGFVGLNAQEGETVGRFLATDRDQDGLLELVATRRGSESFDTFAMTPGQQRDLVLHLKAEGYDPGGALVALGATSSTFLSGKRTTLDMPFNLLPSHRPLRVLSMTPPSGSRSIDGPLEIMAVQLSGDVRAEALLSHVSLLVRGTGEVLYPELTISNSEAGMVRTTTVHLVNCSLGGGEYSLRVGAAVCTTTGQCLDQHLHLEGQQPFEGSFSVTGSPAYSGCDEGIEVMSLSCPENVCPDELICEHGLCVPGVEGTEGTETVDAFTCDLDLCTPPEFVCGEQECVVDCRLYGECFEPGFSCDLDTGLCQVDY